MPTCSVNGTSLYYEDSGAGTPVLFVHGMCGDAHVWHDQVHRLSPRLRCIAYDRRGHSRSPLGDITGRTVELHADDAAALVEALGIAPCVLVGSSGGARIGMDLIRRYPQLFKSAVLSEPPIFGLDPEKGGRQIMADLQPPLEACFREGNPRGAVDAFFDYMCPGLWRRLDDKGREPYRANHKELLPDLQMPAYEIGPEDLARIGVPCTIVSGSESHPVLRRVAQVIADALPGAQFVEFTGSGHVTYAEAPEVFAELVLEAAGVPNRVG